MISNPLRPTAAEVSGNMVWIPEGSYPFRVYLRCPPGRAVALHEVLERVLDSSTEFSGIEWIDRQAPDLIVVNGKEDYAGSTSEWLVANWPEGATLLTGQEAEMASGWQYRRNQNHDAAVQLADGLIPSSPEPFCGPEDVDSRG